MYSQVLGIRKWVFLGDFPGGTMVNNPPASARGTRNVDLTLGSEDPLKEVMATHSSILPGKFCGQRSLESYSPWGHKESKTTEHTCVSLGNHYSAYHRGKLESIVFLVPDITKRRK